MSTWTASVYTLHVTMFPRGSVCVHIVHVVKTSIRNFFGKSLKRKYVSFGKFNVHVCREFCLHFK